jgi:hypothetical protein
MTDATSSASSSAIIEDIIRLIPAYARPEGPDASRENDHAPRARSSSVEVVGGVPTREIARRIGVAASTVRPAAEGVWLRVIRRGWPKI